MEAQTRILAHLENRIKTITINYPKAKNAVDIEANKHILKHLQESLHDGTRVVILTGAEGNFCSGADLTAGLNPATFDMESYVKTYINPIILQIREQNIPVIAKVRGVCAGVGANYALACDMVFVSPTTMISQIFTNIGLSSDGGGSYFMYEQLGFKKAFELMATAQKISAEKALQLNLINDIIADDALDAYVQTLAETLANGAYVAIQHTKSNLREATKGSLADVLNKEAENQAINFKTKDFMEGILAFMQKRKPNYKGE